MRRRLDEPDDVATGAQEYVDAYLEVANITEDRRGPLFRRTGPGPRDALLEEGLTRHADLPAEICAHSFRGTGIRRKQLRLGSVPPFMRR